MDSCVVVATYTECALSEDASVFNVCLCTLFIQYVKQHRVFGFAWYDNHIVEVFSSRTNERDSADINFFNDILL